MEISAGDVYKLCSSVPKAKSAFLGRGERITFLHQTVLALSNVLDLESDKSPSHSAGIQDSKTDASLASHGFPSYILQTHRLRAALQKCGNADKGIALAVSSTNDNQKVETDSRDCMKISERHNAILQMTTSVQDLIQRDWLDLFQENPQIGNYDTSDPFYQQCFIDEQSKNGMLHQLQQIKDRCKEITSNSKQMEYNGGNEDITAQKCTGGTIVSESEGDYLEYCVWRLEERLHGYEDCIDQLLTDYCKWLKDRRWIECLETNHHLLSQHRWIQKLFETGLYMASHCKSSPNRTDEDLMLRVLKLSAKCFADLPLPLQSSLFQWLWKQPNGPTLFQHHAVINTQQELTSIFNRLSSSGDYSQITELAREVCNIALHCPSLTLEKALQQAITNTDAGQLVCKVLQCIPFLANLKGSNDDMLLVDKITQFLLTVSKRDFSSTEEANLMYFLEHLIKPYHSVSHPDIPIPHPPLLLPDQLAEACILPFLHPCGQRGPVHDNKTDRHASIQTANLNANDATADAVPPYLLLKLLDLTFESAVRLRPSKSRLCDLDHVFPIMLCLCQLLENCSALWDGGIDVAERSTVKELTSELLRKLAHFVKNTDIPEVILAGVQWLLDNTASMDWTTRLTVALLFEDVALICKQHVQMCVKNMQDLFQHYAEEIEASSSDITCADADMVVPKCIMWSNKLTVLLQGCRISVDIAHQFIKDFPICHSRQDFFQALCLALVQILPQSTLEEWKNLLDVLDMLLASSLLHVACTNQFSNQLPLFDYTMYRRPLQLRQLFTSVMQLLASPSCSEMMSTPMWQYVARCYALTMKEVLKMISSIQNACGLDSAHSALFFVIGQQFCHTCEVMSTVPSAANEQLFVLSLELLIRLEELIGQGDDDVMHTWTNQRTALSEAVTTLPNSEQRNTLMHKLFGI